MKRTFLLLVLFCGSALAQDTGDKAGTVIFATAGVSAERDPPETLVKGDAVRVSDTVVTAESARAQLLMIDGAKIAIRPNSRLKIEEYSYPQASDDSGAVVASGEGRSVTSLLKGGFRTITGAIGKEDERDYEVRTAVGVLGIRGTDYTAVFCNADCGGPAAPVEDGLYLGVNEGTIFFRNENGDIELRAGQYAFIPLSDRTLRRLAEPPPVLGDAIEFSQRADGSAPAAQGVAADESTNGFDSRLGTRRAPDSSAWDSAEDEQKGEGGRDAPAQSVIGVNPDGTPVDITPGETPRPQGNRTISWSSGPVDVSAPTFSGTLDNEPTLFSLDAGNNLTGFGAPFPGRTGPDLASFDIGTSTNVDTGFDSVTVLRWGRWAGGTAGITLSDGSDASLDLSSQSLHWVSGPESMAPPAMPVTGVASYTLIGSTSPTDNFGNTGVLGSATFSADFTNNLVDSTLVIDINASTWTAAGQGTIGSAGNQPLPAHQFSGSYNAVTIDGASGGFGLFSGFFSEPGDTSDPAFPGGVGMTYSLQDMGGTTEVSGALVFGNP